MSNLPKKLEEATNEELYSWVNEHDPNYTKLASDELTRRKFEKFDKNTSYFSMVLGFFAVIQIIVAVMQFALSVQISYQNFWEKLLVILLLFLAIIIPLDLFYKIIEKKK